MESIRENITRQAAIDGMSDDELRHQLANRGKKVVRELIPAAISSSRISVPLPSVLKVGDPGVSSSVSDPDAAGKVSGEKAGVTADGDGEAGAGSGKSGETRKPAKPGETGGLFTLAGEYADDDRVKVAGSASQGGDERPHEGVSGSNPASSESLMDLAASGKQAVFDGPSAMTAPAHERPEDDEELLEVEMPAVAIELQSLNALELRHLRQRRRRVSSVRPVKAAPTSPNSPAGDVSSDGVCRDEHAAKDAQLPLGADGARKAGKHAASGAKVAAGKPAAGKVAAGKAKKHDKHDGHDKAKKHKKGNANPSAKAKKSAKKGQEGNHA